MRIIAIWLTLFVGTILPANAQFKDLITPIQFNGCMPGFCGSKNGGGGGGALVCTNTPVTTGTQGTVYTGSTPAASGGTPSYTFSETGALPSGLTIAPSTGIISGTPSVSGTFTGIQVKVTDSASTVANCGSAFTLVIAPSVATTTWNPSDKGAAVTLSGGNLTVGNTTFAFGNVRAIASHSSGKYYFETTLNSVNYLFDSLGVANSSEVLSGNPAGSSANSVGWAFQSGGQVTINGTTIGTGAFDGTPGGVVAIAIDLTSKLFWVRFVSSSNATPPSFLWNSSGTADPATGVGGFSLSTLAAGPYFPMATVAQTADNYTANFGATAYAGAVPSGFGNW